MTTPENITHVPEMMIGDSRLSSRQGVMKMGISQERADNILIIELGMSKAPARWVLRLLIQDQKQKC